MIPISERLAVNATLEDRLQLQEDVLGIMQLKARYCRAADCGWDRHKPDAQVVADLFIEEGIWDAGPSFAQLKGRKAIRNYFESKQHPFGMHMVSNPIIHVNGDRATGQWQLFCPGIVENNRSIWIGAIYDDQFVRTADGWRFKVIKVTIAFTQDADPGFMVNRTFGG